jgi:hypothetical protein
MTSGMSSKKQMVMDVKSKSHYNIISKKIQAQTLTALTKQTIIEKIAVLA